MNSYFFIRESLTSTDAILDRKSSLPSLTVQTLTSQSYLTSFSLWAFSICLDKVPWQLSPAFNFSPADYLLDVLWSYLMQLDSSINHPGFSPALFMISELSHSKTTSFSHIYCFFPFYVPKLKTSHLENPSKTEKPDHIWKPYDHWKSTAHVCNNQGGAYLLGYLSHRVVVME